MTKMQPKTWWKIGIIVLLFYLITAVSSIASNSINLITNQAKLSVSTDTWEMDFLSSAVQTNSWAVLISVLLLVFLLITTIFYINKKKWGFYLAMAYSIILLAGSLIIMLLVNILTTSLNIIGTPLISSAALFLLLFLSLPSPYIIGTAVLWKGKPVFGQEASTMAVKLNPKEQQKPKGKFCSNCGKPLEKNGKFCANCGAKI